jgi:diguanylate cyclase (GGDEF)-like protein
VADELNEERRLAAVASSGLLDDLEIGALDRLSRLAAGLTATPVALVNVIGEREQTTVAGHSNLERFGTSGKASLERSFCKYVVQRQEPFVVTDAREDPLLAGNPSVIEDHVIAYLGVPLYAPGGEVLGALCALDEQPRDWSDGDRAGMEDLASLITDELALREARKEVESLARRDPLTGLANRRRWDEQAVIEMSRAERDETPLAVVLMDLDGFKFVNDEQGHAAGDALLSDLAAIWEPLIRLPDLLARLGGDEFGVLLPGAADGDGDIVGERLRAAAADRIGVSYGSARWPPGSDFAQLMARADAALYERKRAR